MSELEVKRRKFGILSDGTKCGLYIISNGKMKVCVSEYGCIITSILIPNPLGKLVDVLLGYSTLDGFITLTKMMETIPYMVVLIIGKRLFGNLEDALLSMV